MTSPQHSDPAWVDGSLVPLHSASVPLLDRGLLFGEAAYETLWARNGRVFARTEHLERLRGSLTGIGLSWERALPRVEAGLAALLAEAPRQDGLLYVQVTGGTAPRAHVPPGAPPPPAVYAFWTRLDPARLRDQQERGLAAVTVPDQRWRRASLKTTQLLGGVLATREARERGAHEALLLDAGGRLTEGGSSNVFVLSEERMLTPSLEGNLLPGVTRARLLAGRPDLVAQGEVGAARLASAEEIFIASTSRPVVPVVTLDGRSVGAGAPGAVTRELQGWLQREMERELGA